LERYKNEYVDREELERVLKKDEQETRYEKVVKHRKRLKQIRRSVKMAIVTIIIVGIGLYLLTPLSNIKILKVNNNIIYSQQQILKKAGLSYKGKMIFHPVYFVEKRLRDDALIKDASVHKDYLSGRIYIDIQEEKVIGQYVENNKTYVLLENNKSVELDDSQLELISSPYIVDLNEKQRKKLADSFSVIDSEYIALVSEIRHFQTSYDDDMLELLMQDGRIVRTSYGDATLLESYRGLLEKYNSDLRCIYFVDSNAHSESCE